MKETFLERRDPRVKICLAFFFASLVATTRSWHLLLGAGLLAASWQWLSRKNFWQVLRKISAANLFLLLVLVTLPFTTPGRALFSLGPLVASEEGFELALLIFVKSNLILWATLLLLGTSSPFSLAHALHHLRLPSKLVQLLFFTYRYLELLKREFHRLWEAAKLRSFTPGTNLHTYRTMAYLVGTLLVRSYDRSQRVYEAMLCRGFNGYFPVYRHFSLSQADLLFAVFYGGLLLALACLVFLS